MNEGTSEALNQKWLYGFSSLNPQKYLLARSFNVKKVWGHAPPTIFHLDAPGVVNHHGPPRMILLTTALDQKVWHNRG